ncbi:hypothetical protein [Shewanella violacea]|uniref:Lipoprotein n=1 Tax=Shewanella violacea (strain JCM 10179 / CIP 106290 / LMG 19151 / DSS12) TaxID=637905 RepID=D4ZJU6_SHEVD|nr:hypothetical protein [Shewanella violacea]BAJ01945.1 hypothetical protein SVI_1974 [Shewanella violacea DSS12]
MTLNFLAARFNKLALSLVTLTMITGLSACDFEINPSPSPEPKVYVDGVYVDDGSITKKLDRAHILADGFWFDYVEKHKTDKVSINNRFPINSTASQNKRYYSTAFVTPEGEGKVQPVKATYVVSTDNKHLIIKSRYKSTFEKMDSAWPQQPTIFQYTSGSIRKTLEVDGNTIYEVFPSSQRVEYAKLNEMKHGSLRMVKHQGREVTLYGVWTDPDSGKLKLILTTFNNRMRGNGSGLYTEK